MTQWLVVCVLVLSMHGSLCQYPSSEYQHSLAREEMVSADISFGGKNFTMTEDERIARNYLNYLKVDEFKRTGDDFPPARPIEIMIDNITSSRVYEVLYRLPKGGNMHTHENHQLSKRTLLDIVWNSSDFQNLYLKDPEGDESPWKLDFFLDPPEGEGWILVAEGAYSKEEILQHHTLVGIMTDYAKARPTISGLRWRDIDPLWERGTTQLICNINVKREYVRHLLNQALDEGTQYIEARKHLGPDETIYELRADCQEPMGNGKCRVGDAELDINITEQVVQEVMRERPQLIGIRRIVYGVRTLPAEAVEATMERVVNLTRDYPDHVVAFDMVAEEDAGNSHLYFLDSYLKLSDPDNEGERRTDIKFHVGETSWPIDLTSASDVMDPVSTQNNLFEALLLQTSRIGHGAAFSDHPYLVQVIKERGLAVEVCPVSNQLLGYYPDLRHHPAANYIRQGIPIILGSDDAGTFGVDNFTLDWYEAFMAWHLDLLDLRQMALDSLRYSSMSEEQKQAAIDNKWQPEWDRYVAELRAEACAMNFSTSDVIFSRIFPRDGALDTTTMVHVYGRRFERGICAEIVCMFGSQPAVTWRYVSTSHIVCEAPIPVTYNVHNRASSAVNVTVSFDGGVTFLNTGETFTYRYTTEPVISGVVSKSPTICTIYGLFLLSLTFYLKEGF